MFTRFCISISNELLKLCACSAVCSFLANVFQHVTVTRLISCFLLRRFNHKWRYPKALSMNINYFVVTCPLHGNFESNEPWSTSLFANGTTAFQENCSIARKQILPFCGHVKHLGSPSCEAVSNNVDFNAKKSADLVVGSKLRTSASLCMNDIAIRRVQSHIHLAIVITSDLQWNDRVAIVLKKKVTHALNLTLTLAYRHRLSPEVSFESSPLALAFVRPRMEYCNGVGCGALAGSIKLLEKSQLKMLRNNSRYTTDHTTQQLPRKPMSNRVFHQE